MIWRGMRNSRRSVSAVPLASAIVALLLVVAYFIPLPYYIYSPGMAIPIQTMVDVQGGKPSRSGAFYMMTVTSLYASNIYVFLTGLLTPHRQIWPAGQIAGGLTEKQYLAVEKYMMQQAQQDAVGAALRYLNLPVRVTTAGVEVLSVEPFSKAAGVLQPGDILTGIDGVSLAHDPNALAKILAGKKVGQSVTLQVLRRARKMAVTVALVNLNQGRGRPLAGIGVIPALAQRISSPTSVRIHVGDVYGPSAGLMFSLEIVSQLAPRLNLTRGYKIAGTGTMSLNGTVGQIGGAGDKVIAAAAAGARYFFVPADVQSGDTNALHAAQEAAKLHTTMKIVPVSTLAQAVSYLRRLPMRHS